MLHNQKRTPSEWIVFFFGKLHRFRYAILKVLHSNVHSIKEFLPYYMYFVNCQEDNEYKSWTKEGFKNLICHCLEETHIPFDVLEENGNYFVFPNLRANYANYLHTLVPCLMDGSPIILPVYIKLSDFQNQRIANKIYEDIIIKIIEEIVF